MKCIEVHYHCAFLNAKPPVHALNALDHALCLGMDLGIYRRWYRLKGLIFDVRNVVAQEGKVAAEKVAYRTVLCFAHCLFRTRHCIQNWIGQHALLKR